jgi:type 1 fimbriae regulatory protein FimB/type 1 fimbriae regulatory protein FimE
MGPAGKIYYFRQSMDEQKNLPPRKKKNAEQRSAEFLEPADVARLMAAAKKHSQYGDRDALIIHMLYKHGLRVSELVALRWEQFDFERRIFNVQRKKNGVNVPHPLDDQAEIKALKRHRKQQLEVGQDSPYVFLSHRGTPLSPRAVHQRIQVAGREAGLGPAIHPHMLRHSCGYGLISNGVELRIVQGFLGHRNIQNTTIYTSVQPKHFKGIWNK